WVAYKLIIDQLPIAKIKTKDTVYRRIRKLVAANVLVPHPDNQSRGQTYYRFGQNYDMLIFSQRSENNPNDTENNTNRSDEKSEGGTDEKSDYYNTSIYNNTISINKNNAEK